MESDVARLDPRAWMAAEWTVTVSSAESRNEVPTTSAATDEDLVTATKAGSRDAFDRLVERYRRPVYQLCYRYVSNHEEASDLAQDVFLRAYGGLAGFKGRSAFRTWLYRIAVNVSLNRVSATAPRLDRMVSLDLVEPPDTSLENPGDALLREERAARVRRAIAQLPPKQRATVILRVYHELSHEEIAQVLGTTVGACKANLFHALAKLREGLRS
jgi:RNA polymerase sigma-70 factor (ECF subfamily)